MPRIRDYVRLYPWNGGLNTSVDPLVMDPQQITIADNIMFTTSGTRKKRGGQARHNTAAISTANFIFFSDYWANVSGTKTQWEVSVNAGGNVYRTKNGAQADNFSTAALAVAHGKISSVVFNDDFILGFSTGDPPKKWNNQDTTANLVDLSAVGGTAPSGWILQLNRGRVFLAGDADNPDTLFFSAPNDHEDWGMSTLATSTGGNLLVFPGDGDPEGITSIFPELRQGGLYVAKRSKLYFVDNSSTNPNDWAVIQVSDNIGCVSHSTAKAVDQQDVVFCSDRGIHSLGQVISGTAIRDGSFLSDDIHESYHAIFSTADREKMSAVWHPRRNTYFLSTKESGRSAFDRIYGFNIKERKWFRWTNVEANFLATRRNATDNIIEMMSAGDAGFINKLDQDSASELHDFDNAVGIPSCVKTSQLAPGRDFSLIPGEKHFTGLAFVFRSRDNSTFRYIAKVDGQQNQTGTVQQKVVEGNILGTTILGPAFILGSVQALKPAFVHIKGVGHTIQVTIEHDEPNKDFELLGLYVEYLVDSESQNHLRQLPAEGS